MLCIHSFLDDHLGCFQFGAIVNDVAEPICVQVFAGTSVCQGNIREDTEKAVL